MAYDIDFDARSLIQKHIERFLLHPDFWNDATNQIALPLVWKKIEFNSANKKKVPNKLKGVYCFTIKPFFNNFISTEYLVYVGKTSRNFRKRFGEYLDEQSGKRKPRWKVFRFLKLYPLHLHYYYAEITSNIDIDQTEEKLLNTFVPKANTEIPKVKIKPELIDIYNL